MNIRWLVKQDGTRVLQYSEDHDGFWKDTETIQEPEPKKELAQVLFEAFQDLFQYPVNWKNASQKIKAGSFKQAQAAREYLKNESANLSS